MGNTWNRGEISSKVDSTRLKFCSFPTDTIGYVVVTGERAMSQERQIIYKTTDKGKTWTFVEIVEPPSKEIG